jgi:hypothetical protein
MVSAAARRLGRIPRAGRICFIIAFVNAAIWGVVVPPFQVPDEASHFAYVQYLVEVGKPPPQGPATPWSPEEETALEQLSVPPVVGFATQRGVLTASENNELHHVLAGKLDPTGGGGNNAASNQPPLYYALEAIPYSLSPSHEILSRLAFMRLLSAILAGLTVLTVFLFVREFFPHTPWTWTIGGLLVAFQPQVNFIAAGVNGDNLLYLASALTFLLLLRTYKRGFTMARAAAIGAAVAVGVLAKITFIALLPGIALAILLLTWRRLSAGHREALKALAVCVTVAVAPVALYAVLNVAVWNRGGGLTAGGLAATNSHLTNGSTVTWHETLDYIWQLYLPRLWFMNHSFFPDYQLTNTWLDGMIGHFGWLDYTFPRWVYKVAEYLFAGLAILALVGAWRLRSGLRALWPLLACFAVTAIGLMAAIGYTGVRYQLSSGEPFAQARYLFPLLAFYAVFLVLAARGLPRRWAPVLGVLLVVLAMAHGFFAETLTISRYYG